MSVQTVFQRYEIKYIMTRHEKEIILKAMQSYMKLDDYGHTTIRNIYFDTPNFRLIRRSIEKPVYKEKLRIRSYQAVSESDPVFVELKKKFDDVVYKRRLTVTDLDAKNSFENNAPLPVQSQIASEIEYFRNFYKELQPQVFLSYEREAYYSYNGDDFRVTFDENILYRDHDFSLGSEIYGTPLLEEKICLMEVKTTQGLPLWMCKVINDLGLRKTSYSKYGAAYQNMVQKGKL